ncbi:MAG: hypothetical protein ACI9HG_000124 [Flavobacteriales bacterium]|jgi:hypothetical protein
MLSSIETQWQVTFTDNVEFRRQDMGCMREVKR